MSKRRPARTHRKDVVVCACDTPTRDQAFMCDKCLDDLAHDLHELLPAAGHHPDPIGAARFAIVGGVPTEWCPLPRPTVNEPGLWASLQSVIAGERGIDYRTLGGSSGGSEKGAVATGIVLDEVAIRRADHLRKTLRQLVVACMAKKVGSIAPDGWEPRSAFEVPAMVEWLLWRIPGLAWHPETVRLAHALRDAITAARKSVDAAPDRQNLGPCLVDGCDGHYRPMRDDTFATCNKCGCWVEAQLLRDGLIRELEDQLVTAAEVARLSTFLGLRANRDTVRKRVNQWASRGRITPTGHDSAGDPRFRFRDIYDLLVQHEHQTDNPTPARSKP